LELLNPLLLNFSLPTSHANQILTPSFPLLHFRKTSENREGDAFCCIISFFFKYTPGYLLIKTPFSAFALFAKVEKGRG
jgi:hypothetical protein